ncbi:UNVERIFIED_CONTAM: hypothetical protein Slati_2738000 [Sesamum latifolium]|uniref:Reverse transcriptase n=1 Tax=Sesamum latifolium TaxID=2727402 RepID=A0AAW2VWT3_9LAMI
MKTIDDELTRLFTLEEITQALNQMHPLKSPGPDGVAVVAKHEKYLGLPTVVGRSKKELFEGIKDRIWKKLHSWSSKQLSQAGRSVLLKSIIHMIPTYVIRYLASSKAQWRTSFELWCRYKNSLAHVGQTVLA